MATFDYRKTNVGAARSSSGIAPAPANGGGRATISKAVPGADRAIFPDLNNPNAPADYAAEVRKRAKDLLSGIDRSAERNAYQDQLSATTASNVKSTGARMGLGGLGMSGAAAAGENQARLVGRNNEAVQLGQYDTNARAEDLSRLQSSFALDQAVTNSQREAEIYAAAIAQLEDELGYDINKDGIKGTAAATGSNSAEVIGDKTTWPTYNWNEKSLDGTTKVASDELYDYYQGANGEKFKVRKTAVAYSD